MANFMIAISPMVDGIMHGFSIFMCIAMGGILACCIIAGIFGRD